MEGEHTLFQTQEEGEHCKSSTAVTSIKTTGLCAALNDNAFEDDIKGAAEKLRKTWTQVAVFA
jgi:hypothetical protein